MQDRIMHLMTQDNQPIGSKRKCCEKCGYAYWKWGSGDSYVSYLKNFTKDVAKSSRFVRCGDKSTN